jgi:acyl carrier protein
MEERIKELIDIIKREVANVMNTAAEEIDEDINLLELGVSSIEAMQIINSIKEELQVDVSPAIIFEYQTIGELASFLAGVAE